MSEEDANVFEREQKKRNVVPLRPEAEAKPARLDLSRIPLTPAAWAARPLERPDLLMGELFTTTSRVLIAADTGLGKSMFGLALAFAMRLGQGFLHWRSHRPARVLVLDGEMPRDLLQERIRIACAWFGVEPPEAGLFILSREDMEDMPPLDSEDGHAWLLAVIEAVGGIDFVVLDNCACLAAGDLREETTWRAMVPLARELSKRKIGQLWLHHVGHDKSKVYGSRAFAWQMDAVGVGTAVSRPGADVSMKIEWQKARRRNPANRGDFETIHMTLEGSVWSMSASTEKPSSSPGRPSRGMLNDRQSAVLEELKRTAREERKWEFDMGEFAEVCRRAGILSEVSPSRARALPNEIRLALAGKDLLTIDGDRCRLIRLE